MRFFWFDSETQSSDRILGAKVYLRPARRRDFRAWAKLRAQSRDFLAPWEPTWSEDALEFNAFRRRISADAKERVAGTGFGFFVVRRGDDALLGGIGLSNVRRGVAQTASVGYWIGSPYARRGYMADALGALLRHAFDTLALHRVEAACLPENTASRRLLRKFGFREEGYARRYLRINGGWADHVMYALLKEEFNSALGVTDNAGQIRGVYA
jgi:[ribosomal protein S5]-alanine N-acetyltransferase